MRTRICCGCEWVARARSVVCFGTCGAALILDAGCGTGRLGRVVCQSLSTTRPVSLDASPDMLGLVDPRLGPRVRGSLLALPFTDDSFDLAIVAWSLETTPDPQLGLDECLRVLRPGGTLAAAFCTMPSSRFVRLITRLPRRVVERSFAGCFLDPTLCPTVPHEVLHRCRGRLQLAVQVSFRKPLTDSSDSDRCSHATSCEVV